CCRVQFRDASQKRRNASAKRREPFPCLPVSRPLRWNPMERSTVLVLLLAPALAGSADAPTPAAARQRWLRGNTAEAREAYETLAKDPKHAVPAAIGLSHTWEDEGEYDKAAAVIDEALKAAADNADLLARRAELFAVRGRLDDAIKTADKAIAKQDD